MEWLRDTVGRALESDGQEDELLAEDTLRSHAGARQTAPQPKPQQEEEEQQQQPLSDEEARTVAVLAQEEVAARHAIAAAAAAGADAAPEGHAEGAWTALRDDTAPPAGAVFDDLVVLGRAPAGTSCSAPVVLWRYATAANGADAAEIDVAALAQQCAAAVDALDAVVPRTARAAVPHAPAGPALATLLPRARYAVCMPRWVRAHAPVLPDWAAPLSSSSSTSTSSSQDADGDGDGDGDCVHVTVRWYCLVSRWPLFAFLAGVLTDVLAHERQCLLSPTATPPPPPPAAAAAQFTAVPPFTEACAHSVRALLDRVRGGWAVPGPHAGARALLVSPRVARSRAVCRGTFACFADEAAQQGVAAGGAVLAARCTPRALGTALGALLLAQSTVVVARDAHAAAAAVLALRALLHPFAWRGACVPLLAPAHARTLLAGRGPQSRPVLAGMRRRPRAAPHQHALVVLDLDTRECRVPAAPALPPLPHAAHLEARLAPLLAAVNKAFRGTGGGEKEEEGGLEGVATTQEQVGALLAVAQCVRAHVLGAVLPRAAVARALVATAVGDARVTVLLRERLLAAVPAACAAFVARWADTALFRAHFQALLRARDQQQRLGQAVADAFDQLV